MNLTVKELIPIINKLYIEFYSSDQMVANYIDTPQIYIRESVGGVNVYEDHIYEADADNNKIVFDWTIEGAIENNGKNKYIDIYISVV